MTWHPRHPEDCLDRYRKGPPRVTFMAYERIPISQRMDSLVMAMGQAHTPAIGQGPLVEDQELLRLASLEASAT